jgi:hypothetical protein
LHSPGTQRIAPRSTQPRAVASRPTQVRGTALPTPARGLALAASCRREGLCSAAIEGRQRVAGGGHTAPGIHAPTTAAQLRHHWSVRIIVDITSMGKGERQMLMPTSTSSAKRQSFCFKKSNPLKFTVTATIVCSGRTSSSSSLLTSGISVFSGSRHQNPRLQSVVLSSFPMPRKYTHTHWCLQPAPLETSPRTHPCSLSTHCPAGMEGGYEEGGGRYSLQQLYTSSSGGVVDQKHCVAQHACSVVSE